MSSNLPKAGWRVQGLGLGFRVQGLGFRGQGLGVQGWPKQPSKIPEEEGCRVVVVVGVVGLGWVVGGGWLLGWGEGPGACAANLVSGTPRASA